MSDPWPYLAEKPRVTVLLCLLCLLCLLTPRIAEGRLPAGEGSARAAGGAERWLERARVGMEVGPTGAQFGGEERDDQYAARFDGREIVRKCVEASCEYVVIWARDGEYAYYDSKIMPKPPGFGERDALRETVDGRP